jgi:hypothetical protein
MIRNITLIALLLLAASCKKQDQAERDDGLPVKSVINGTDMLEYREPSGAFESNAPANWKLRETSDLGPEVTFIAPGTATRPFSVNISFAKYPNPMDKSPDPLHYYNGLSLIESYKLALPFGKRTVGGREVESYAFEHPFRKMHSKKVEYQQRNETVIFRIPGGFWVIEHHAPADEYKATYPIFEAVVASFKPGPIPAPKP